ncbi:hypothetical protein [Glaciimonas soli]|uniref:Uncharacterized protein n=1 Tax=Glaciimonas soli TaxID=2590999 RepID=A0A843YKB1_9BURK|nr:hypothetical protein [Glaciimonas soli]MQQ99399.1 hypothetical protein [Glaciimonas soli]
MPTLFSLYRLTLLLFLLLAAESGLAVSANINCAVPATSACFFGINLADSHSNNRQGEQQEQQDRPQSGQTNLLHFYASLPFDANTQNDSEINTVLIVMHGHPRDANLSFNAALAATVQAQKLATTLVIAPLFQVSDPTKCHTANTPPPETNDLLWTCTSWMKGGIAKNAAVATSITSFAAMDQLVRRITQRYPTIRTVTITGFSAGAQMVQHYIAFANLADPSYSVRFVVADPGSWLYFDGNRPQPFIANQAVPWSACELEGKTDFGKCDVRISSIATSTTALNCPAYNHWKYGTDQIPSQLLQQRNAEEARKAYQQADVTIIEAALDNSQDRRAFYKILDKSCSAELQGPYRLQRGLAYALYDQEKFHVSHHRMMDIVPDCGHNVSCVFSSEIARKALFP